MIDEAGRVHAFPRRPRLRVSAGVLRPTWPCDSDLPPLERSVTLVCRYEPDGCWRVQSLKPGEAFLDLMQNTVRARTQSDASMRAVGELVRNTRAFSAIRGEACDAVPRILKLFETR